ncbi:MAG: flagella basal body P-ring formation protein FlgA [Alphaproteobacteria bacterium]|nr:flagella basal body P-ring formation protein FlgA [Alphaproteobacteria bacterium]
MKKLFRFRHPAFIAGSQATQTSRPRSPNKSGMTVWVLALFMMASPAHAALSESPTLAAPKYNFRLSYEDTEQAVGIALAEKGAGAKVAATVMGARGQALYSADKPISVEIRGLTFDKNTQRWSANVLCISEDEVVSAMPIGGRYEEVAELPVLKRAVRAEDVIKDEDIELRDYPLSRVHGDVVSDLAALVGKSPLRSISAGRPIRDAEISAPNVVNKNSIVQMRYTTAGMQITTSGQVQTDGGVGQVVAVRNLTSKKVVYAVVNSENSVTVLPAGTQQVSQQVGAKAYETN